MIALDELIQEFEVIGINPNEEVLIKCKFEPNYMW